MTPQTADQHFNFGGIKLDPDKHREWLPSSKMENDAARIVESVLRLGYLGTESLGKASTENSRPWQ
jgi:hypothetical protein